MRTTIALLAAFALAGSRSFSQTTWYVDVTSPPPGSGTEADPFASLQSALENPAAVATDRVLVAPGTYVEALAPDLEPRSIESTGGPLVTTIQAPPGASRGIDFTGTGGWLTTFSGFTIEGNGTSTGCFIGWGGAGRLENCVVRGHALGAYNAYDFFLDNCTIVGNQNGLEHRGGGHGNDALTFIYSSIFWDNTRDLAGTNLFGYDFTMEDSLLDTDPMFFGSPDDLHLRPGSAAIDAGDDARFDPDGSRLDMGALPFDPSWPVGASYCAPTPNSGGGPGRVVAGGTHQLGAGNLVLLADRLPPGQTTLFFHGNDYARIPLGNGVLCSGGPYTRLGIRFADPMGSATLGFDPSSPPPGVPPAAPGETLMFQVWFRDATAAPGFSNLTNAVAVTFTP